MSIPGLLDALRGLEDSYLSAPQCDIVPVAIELHTDSVTPVGVFERFVGSDIGFLLESVEEGQRYGRFSFLGRRPLGRFVRDDTGQNIVCNGVFDNRSGFAFDVAQAFLHETVFGECIGASIGDLPFATGLVGVFGWDSVRAVEKLPPRQSSSQQQPESSLLAVGELVAFDHFRQTITLIYNAAYGTPWADIVHGITAMANDLMAPSEEFIRLHRSRNDLPIATAVRSVSNKGFQAMVVAAKEQIAAGEVFQIVLSQRFDVGAVAHPFSVYRVLRQVNPSSYLYFVQTPEVTVVGASPESLVRLRDGVVTTRPIAGSRPRGDNETENRARAASLLEDPKEIAEHIMLVDLGRNDIGRVSQYGTVAVDELMTVETYSHIMHLTSQVSGRVRDGIDGIDVLRATFPAGTLSGAPKVRAMELITEMEPEGRGLYGGAIGYFDSRGNFDSAILIRTLVVNADGNGSVQAGAGIVWDSDPQTEDEECLAKAEAILRAVGGASS
jgi:anthranilate synthase component 1